MRSLPREEPREEPRARAPVFSRSIHLRCAAVGVLSLWLSALQRVAETPASPPGPPNVVVLLTDDQAWNAMAPAGHPFLQTPGMDRLAAEGVRFESAFVTTSLCTPARASFLTGRYVRAHCILGNADSTLPEESVATILAAAGYDTAYVGKWHFRTSTERPGFGWTATYPGQGEYFDCTFLANGRRQTHKGWVDDVATDYAIEFLSRPRDVPFFLFVGFKGPHEPRQPPPRHAQLYEDATLPTRPNTTALPPFPRAGEQSRLPGKFRGKFRVENWREGFGPRPAKVEEAGTPLDPRLRDYYQVVTGVDDNVTRILDALDALNLTDDTLVVFASDNGLLLGEHGLADKRAAYEASMRIPFLVRFPRCVRPAVEREALVLNIDLAPTIVDYAGIPVPTAMQGLSLRPLLEGRTDVQWRSSFLYEYYRLERKTPTVLAVRTADWKLITYPDFPGWTELFHVAEDPYEMRNLAGASEHAQQRHALESLLAEHERTLGPRPYAPGGR